MANGGGTASISGQLKQWHKVTLEFAGPKMGETASTFLDHRLDVTFRHEATGKTVTVPGHFAADGNAAHSGAAEGSVWRAHFNPTEAGEWSWTASFRQGDGVAVAANAKAGASGGHMDGAAGQLVVAGSDKAGADLRGKGLLEHDGDQYLNHAGTGEVFLKSGVGSPENLLAYHEFDNTPGSHAFAAHARHFEAGDPTWDGGKGKALIGAVNYLADQGVNSAYMLLMNVGGDGQDVWPWAATNLDGIAKNAGSSGGFNLTHQAHAFDVSKLDQWEIVFEHMQQKGITLHLFLQETENDHLLNDGNMGLERMLFMREMVARFGHHNGLIWNLGEETTNTPAQIKAHSAALKALDAYDHPVALHTYPTQHARYDELKGSGAIDVLSFQTNGKTVPDLDRYVGGAEKAGHAVAAFLDESGGASVGLAAEGDAGWQQNHAEMRDLLWRSYMDGASGAEWYFGYSTGGGQAGDLAVENFATRHTAYAWAEAAREFFEDLPLERMKGADGLTASAADQVLAAKGEAYAIYLPQGGTTTLDLTGETGAFAVSWHDPLTGATREGTVDSVQGGAKVSIGLPPSETGRAWTAVVRAADGTAPKPKPEPEPGDGIDLVDGDGGSASDVHLMRGGLVVMQAEHGVFAKPGASGNATWELKKGLAGYKGEGYMLWDTGKDHFNTRDAGQDHTGPMKYTFRVDGDAEDVAGTYFISLRAMKPVTGEGSDRNNDFYVAVSEADEGPGAWKKVFFSGAANKWLWGTTYDVNHKKSPATFQIDGPGEHTVWISGRSRQAGLDEIHVQKGSKNIDHNAPTSPFADSTPKPQPKPEPVEPKPEPKPEPVEPTPSKPEARSPAAYDTDGTLTLINASTDQVLAELGVRTVIEAASVNGLDLALAAETDLAGVKSARMLLDGKQGRVEAVEPFALFGDKGGDFTGGLQLARGMSRLAEVDLHGAAGGKGALLGEIDARLIVQNGVLSGTAEKADVFVFSTKKMGLDSVEGFEAHDRIALFGSAIDAEGALAFAKVTGGHTVIDFGGGDVLTLKGFDDLTEDHFVLA